MIRRVLHLLIVMFLSAGGMPLASAAEKPAARKTAKSTKPRKMARPAARHIAKKAPPRAVHVAKATGSIALLASGTAASGGVRLAANTPPSASTTASEVDPSSGDSDAPDLDDGADEATAHDVAEPETRDHAATVKPAAAEDAREREAFFNHNSLVLVEKDKVTRLIAPKSLAAHGRFQVRIARPKPAAEPPPAAAPTAATLSDRVEARRIMVEANEAFFNGDIAKTWNLVAKAEALDPAYYRIKTMKGSLLYKTGSPDLAAEVWQESLAQHPDQPEIVALLRNAGRGGESGQAGAPAGEMAKGAASAPKAALR